MSDYVIKSVLQKDDKMSCSPSSKIVVVPSVDRTHTILVAI